MSKEEKQKLLNDTWPAKYPHGEKALLLAIKKASTLEIFELEEEHGHLRIKHS